MMNPFQRKMRIPSKGWLERMTSKYRYTPDIARLENIVGHYLFICDDLKELHRRHNLISPYPVQAEAVTKDSFAVWVRHLGKESYPIPLPDRCARMPYSRIQGELYFVPTSVIVSIDNYRRNGVEFHRKRIDVRIPHKQLWLDLQLQPKETNWMYHTVEAWMYIGNKIYWENLLDGGLLYGICTYKYFDNGPPNDVGKYYEFTAKDYFNYDGNLWLSEQQAIDKKLIENKEKREREFREIFEGAPEGTLSAMRRRWRGLFRR
jgi:hypothetical protein